MMQGVVTKCLSKTVVVKTEQGKIECALRGVLKLQKMAVVPGDRVEFDENALVVTKVLPRKNLLKRPIVSNADQIFLIIANEPLPDLFLVDQMLVYAKQNALDVVLVLNKEDLHDMSFVENIKSQYEPVVKHVLVVSAKTGFGIGKLTKLLEGRFTIFAGQSGVGKSSLLNAILPQAAQEIGDLSAKIARGKNTTRTSEIFDFGDSGEIVDTPGFSLLNLDIDPRDLARQYDDISRFACECRWPSCNHINKSAIECGVVAAVENGKLNKERYNRYTKLFEKYTKEFKLKQKRGTLYGNKNH